MGTPSYTEVWDWLPPLILDSGSSSIRCGIASEEPQCCLPAVYGRRDLNNYAWNQYEENSIEIGDRALCNKGQLNVVYAKSRDPQQTNWDVICQLWDEAFKSVGTDDTCRSLLFAEDVNISKREKKSIIEILFERLQIHSVLFTPQPLLSLFGTGRMHGTVVDFGTYACTVSPISDGILMRGCIKKLCLGGMDISEYLGRLLVDRGYYFNSPSDSFRLDDVKESKAYVKMPGDISCECLYDTCHLIILRIPNHTCRSGESDNPETVTYLLPDGQRLGFSSERHLCTEILFAPHLLEFPISSSKNIKGVSELLQCVLSGGEEAQNSDFLDTCRDRGHFRNLWSKDVVVCGGTSLLSGLNERIQYELINEPNIADRVTIHSPQNRQYLCYTGGVIWGNLCSVKDACTTRVEFEEWGSALKAIYESN